MHEAHRRTLIDPLELAPRGTGSSKTLMVELVRRYSNRPDLLERLAEARSRAGQRDVRDDEPTDAAWGRVPNTTDFRCLGCREVFLSSSSVSVPDPVSVMTFPG